MAVTWTRLTHTPSGSASAMWVMQDGRILVNLYASTQLAALTPDTTGSYANGTWQNVGKLLLLKTAYASAILSDGRLLTCGAEYTGQPWAKSETNFCEIYDPRTGISTEIEPPSGWRSIGDSPSAVLNDGTFLLGNTQGRGTQVALLDPATLTWTFGVGDQDNEQGYTLLQTGDVLTTGVYSQTSKRYDPSAKAFVPDAPLPVPLGANSETGPGITLMDGRVIWFGATGFSCIYTPGAEGHDGSWVQGPTLPFVNGLQLVAADVPAILEPNGKVFLLAKTAVTPTFVEYDPAHNDFTIVAGAPSLPSRLGCCTLLLPNGHGLVSLSTSAWYDLTFSAGGEASWAPTITSFPATVRARCTHLLTGKQLCGLSECSQFGDDNQQAENYPTVRFVDGTGEVTYARAHNVSTRSIAPGKPGTVLVDIPDLPPGQYAMHAVAMGIPSAAFPVTIVANDPPLVEHAGDMDGDGVDEILVSSHWGIGILKKSGDTMISLMTAPNGTRLGDWVLDTATNRFGPIADFDGDGQDEILVTSAWGMGVLRLAGGALTSISMTANGTDLSGGVKLNTVADQFGPAVLSEGTSARLFYTSCAGVALLQFSGTWSFAWAFYNYGTTINNAGVSWTFGPADKFGPIGDFNGEGIQEIVVTNASGLGVIALEAEWTPLLHVPNGTVFTGGWRLDTSNDTFALAGNFHFNPVATDVIMVTSPWGMGTLVWDSTANQLNTAWLAPNGTVLAGGWPLDTSVDQFGPAWLPQPTSDVHVLVRSPSGIGILGMPGNTVQASMSMSALAMVQNGTDLGGWAIDTTSNHFGPVGSYDAGMPPEIFVTSPWGVGILQMSAQPFAAAMLQPNGTLLGQWVLDVGTNTF
jgi:hypothetical protein